MGLKYTDGADESSLAARQDRSLVQSKQLQNPYLAPSVLVSRTVVNMKGVALLS